MGNDKFTLDVGLALDLKLAFARNGWSEAEVKKLTGGDFLKGVRDVLNNRAEIKPVEHLIDCDATPLIPDGWWISTEDQLPKAIRGLVKWNRNEVKLHLSKKQKREIIRGYDLYKTLKGQAVYTANVLDYLLANPHQIPEEWKDKSVNFWGTVYRGVYGIRSVRYLWWTGDKWDWGWRAFCHNWDSDEPAAVRAS